MKEKILYIIQKGYHEELKQVLINPANQDSLLMLLHQESRLFEAAFKDLLFPLYQSNDQNNSNNIEKFHFENIIYCLRILMAYGFDKRKEFKDEISNMPGYYYRVSNDLNHCFDIKSAVRSYILEFDTLKDFDNYIHFLAKHQAHLYEEIKNEYSELIVLHRNRLISIEEHISNHSLTQFFDNEIENKIKTVRSWDATRNQSDYLMAECACRGYSRKHRKVLEGTLINEARARFDQDKTLKYLSLGAGEFLQDFIIILNLIKEGFKSLDVSLIEPDSYKTPLAPREWLKKIAEENGVKLNINLYHSIDHYKFCKNEDVHLINAIDFENIFKAEVFEDVIETHKLLTPDGYFLFSFDEYKLGLTCSSVKVLVESDSSLPYKKICEDIAKEKIFDKKNLNLALMRPELLMEQWLYLLPQLAEAGASELALTMIHPRKINYFGNFLKEKNVSFNPENLNYFMRLCVSAGAETQLRLVDDPENIVSQQPVNGYDLILQQGIATRNLTELYEKVATLQQACPGAVYYIAAQYVHETGLPVNILEGNVTNLPSINIVYERVNIINEILPIFMQVGTKVQEHISILEKTAGNFLFQYNKEANCLKKALFRAEKSCSDYLRNSIEPNLNELLEILFHHSKGKESLYEAYIRNAVTRNKLTELQLLIQTHANFNISPTIELTEEAVDFQSCLLL